MSVPDKWLEPTDTEWCFEHSRYKPCRYCRDDNVDTYAEAKCKDIDDNNRRRL